MTREERERAIAKLSDIYTGDYQLAEALKLAVEALERKKGMWTQRIYSARLECNQCLHLSPMNTCWDFCPNCGADMRGAHDDQ